MHQWSFEVLAEVTVLDVPQIFRAGMTKEQGILPTGPAQLTPPRANRCTGSTVSVLGSLRHGHVPGLEAGEDKGAGGRREQNSRGGRQGTAEESLPARGEGEPGGTGLAVLPGEGIDQTTETLAAFP